MGTLTPGSGFTVGGKLGNDTKEDSEIQEFLCLAVPGQQTEGRGNNSAFTECIVFTHCTRSFISSNLRNWRLIQDNLDIIVALKEAVVDDIVLGKKFLLRYT